MNCAVDIGPTFETKLACLRACQTMMTHMIKDLNATLAERKLHLPGPAAADGSAINEYTKVALETRDRATGRRFGLDYAEAFHHIGPDRSMDEYIAGHAVPV